MADKRKEDWDYFTGDHFQFWNGATIDDKNVSASTKKKYKELLERIFHSYNICGRIVNHYKNALVGKPFSISLKQRDDPEADVSPDAINLIKQWNKWQGKQNLKMPKAKWRTGSAIGDCVVQALATGTGYLRMYRPKRFQNARYDEHKKILIHCPDLDSIEVKHDDDNQLYWAKYSFGNGKAEIYELLDDGSTKITKADKTEIIQNYGGSLPVFELNAKSLITQDIKHCQNAINKLLTMWDKNMEFAGFPLKVVLGGQPPGEYHEDPATKKSKFVPNMDLLNLSADKLVFIPGLPIGDRRNPSGYTNPGMYEHDPVDVTNLYQTLEAYKDNGYELAGLGHLMAQGGDRISGKSRIAGKEDYISDLGGHEQLIELILVEIFEFLLQLIDKFFPELNLTQYEPVVDLNVSISTPIDEREQNLEEYKEGVMSAQTLIEARGQDSDTERRKINEDNQAKLEYLRQEKEIEEKAKVKSQKSKATEGSIARSS